MRRSARILGVPIDDAAARGDRAARRAARRASPTACCGACATTRRCAPTARSRSTSRTPALKLLEVDEHGFDEVDRRLLRTIIDKFGGGPVGLEQPRRGDQRGDGRDRGHLRAVPDPDRLPRSHAARPRRDAARLRLLRARRARKEGIHDCGDRRWQGRRACGGRPTTISVAGHLRAAARADQRRPREDGRHDRRVDPAAHRHPRAPHRRSRRGDVGPRRRKRRSRRSRSAGLTPDDIGVIVVGTVTPDMMFPSTACLRAAQDRRDARVGLRSRARRARRSPTR